MATFRGTAGDDNLSGTSGDDNFLLFRGGNDTVDAGDGDDIFRMGGALNAGDKLDGGAGKDFVVLNGDYSAGLVFNADTITNIEVMGLAGGHSYNLTLDDGNVGPGQRLLVKAGTLQAGNTLTFDGSAETDGRYTIIAGAGNDTLTGGAKADVFDLSHGGNDTAHGGGGTDTFMLGAAFTSADRIDGGAGSDTVVLAGMGDDSISFTATTMTGVETMVLGAGHFYTLTTNDATVAAGATLTVDASALGTGDPLIFNGSSETDGNFVFKFGGGFTTSDTITGGAGNDTLELHGNYSGGFTFGAAQIASIETLKLDAGFGYNLTTNDANVGSGDTLTVDATALSGTLTFHGAAETNGAYEFDFAGNFTASDSLTGGAGDDTLVLDGDYNGGLVLGASTIVGVETIKLEGGFSYAIQTDDGNVAAGQTLTVDGSALTGTDVLQVVGSPETDGSFHLIGGAYSNLLTGGAQDDIIDVSRGGTNTMIGGGGADLFICAGATGGLDTFVYNLASESTSTSYDTIQNLDFGHASFMYLDPGGVFLTKVDSTPHGGVLNSGAEFDQDVHDATDVYFNHFGDGAVLFAPDSGDLAGHTFLVIDVNADGHYTAGADLVMDVTGYTGTMTVGEFLIF
jgi:hypothetical protein